MDVHLWPKSQQVNRKTEARRGKLKFVVLPFNPRRKRQVSKITRKKIYQVLDRAFREDSHPKGLRGDPAQCLLFLGGMQQLLTASCLLPNVGVINPLRGGIQIGWSPFFPPQHEHLAYMSKKFQKRILQIM